ncbi:ribosomal protein S18-alanine N-acetyltransferase [Shimazuella sp. AN120528]|uniref:ribosomal protein S18-alanine N-acetyltransferase n=1 Tax=Shimazuella soli TaxID=1892854 RepID=UPI001F0D89F0|nr:ribosomal protein S18-alanine N-acetyltransferase [Shimazuella soli]MCH5585396.1 ribosomal protein S18-alanine N-acetyltransferase [Shimazuella soli]
MNSIKTVLFRPMKVTDISSVMEIEKLSFTDPWSEISFEDEITANDLAYYIVSLVDGNVVGYAGMWVVLDEAQLTNVALHPDYRGQGTGKEIVAYMIELAKQLGASKVTLEVRKSNQRAQHLYRNLGFTVIGTRKNYYPDNGEDAILMGLVLNEG